MWLGGDTAPEEMTNKANTFAAHGGFHSSEGEGKK